MNPALQLLWKSRAPLDKDDHDLELISPRLSGADLTWLKLAICEVHPNSPWLGDGGPATKPGLNRYLT